MSWEVLAPLAPQLGLSLVFLVMLITTTTALFKYFTGEIQKRDAKIDEATKAVKEATDKFVETLKVESDKREALVKEVSSQVGRSNIAIENNTKAMENLNETLVDKVYDLLSQRK